MPARPGGALQFGQSRRGTARRARPLGVTGQHATGLGPRLGPLPAHPQGTFSASYDNTLRLWDLAAGAVLGGLFSDSPIFCFAISEATGVGACGHAIGKISVFRVGPKS